MNKKAIQPHFEEILKKLNIISKDQSHMKIMTSSWFRDLIKIILSLHLGVWEPCIQVDVADIAYVWQK